MTSRFDVVPSTALEVLAGYPGSRTLTLSAMPTALLVCLLGLAACGGGSGGEPGEVGIEVVFPRNGGATDEATVLVRGKTLDPAGVHAVTINGVAVSSTDGFATWTAEVPLQSGTNTLVAAVRRGHVTSTRDLEIEIEQSDPWPLRPSGLAFDEARNRLLINDAATQRIIAIDVSTRRRRTLSGPDLGSGPLGMDLRGLALDASTELAFVIDRITNSVIAIDLRTGNRELLSSAQRGMGAMFASPEAMVYDDIRDVLLLTDSAPAAALIAVHPSTGDRTIVSGQGVGNGIDLLAPTNLIVQPTSGNIIVASRKPAGLLGNNTTQTTLRIEPLTGDRAELSLTVMGPSFPIQANTLGLVEGQVPTTIFSFDGPFGGIHRTDLTAGTITGVPLSFEHPVFPDSFASGSHLTTDPRTGRLYCQCNLGLIEVDPSTGQVQRLLTHVRGSGPPISNGATGIGALPQSTKLILDAARNRILQCGPSSSAYLRILSIDLATGEREFLYDFLFTVPSDLVYPIRIDESSLNEAGTKLRIMGRDATSPSNGIFEIDLVERTATRLVDFQTSNPSPWLDVAFPPGSTTGLGVLSNNEIRQVDLLTGMITNLGTISLVPPTLAIRAFEFDAVENRLVASGYRLAQFSIGTIDAVSGAYSETVSYPAWNYETTPVSNAAQYNDTVNLTYDRQGNRLYFAGQILPAVTSVDLASGDVTVHSASPYIARGLTDPPRVGRGPALTKPSSLDVDASGETAYVLGIREATGVYHVDLVTGERVLISR